MGDLAHSGTHYFENVALTGKLAQIASAISLRQHQHRHHPCEIAERFARDRRMSAEPLYLRTLEYSRRRGIELMFSDFKSRRFDIQDTQVQYPDRLGRLILVMPPALYLDRLDRDVERSRESDACRKKSKRRLAVRV